MRALVTGAGGFLGQRLVSRLLERGHSVRAIIRPASTEPMWPSHVEIFRADLRTPDDMVVAFDGMDAVFHLAVTTSGSDDNQFESTVTATERFLEAMGRSSVRRLVHISSLVVYDWTQVGSVLDENTPLLDEANDLGGYTRAKVWQERLVSRYAKTQGFALTIIRPGFIWGFEHAEIAGMGRHLGNYYLMFGPLTRLPLCYVANCADCIVAAAENPDTIGESFNAIDEDHVRVWRYVREYANRTHQGGYFIPIPYYFGLLITYLASRTWRTIFGCKSKLPSLLVPRRYQWQFKPVKFSNQKVKYILNWSQPLNFDECLQQTYSTRTIDNKLEGS